MRTLTPQRIPESALRLQHAEIDVKFQHADVEGMVHRSSITLMVRPSEGIFGRAGVLPLNKD